MLRPRGPLAVELRRRRRADGVGHPGLGAPGPARPRRLRVPGRLLVRGGHGGLRGPPGRQGRRAALQARGRVPGAVARQGPAAERHLPVRGQRRRLRGHRRGQRAHVPAGRGGARARRPGPPLRQVPGGLPLGGRAHARDRRGGRRDLRAQRPRPRAGGRQRAAARGHGGVARTGRAQRGRHARQPGVHPAAAAPVRPAEGRERRPAGPAGAREAAAGGRVRRPPPQCPGAGPGGDRGADQALLGAEAGVRGEGEGEQADRERDGVDARPSCRAARAPLPEEAGVRGGAVRDAGCVQGSCAPDHSGREVQVGGDHQGRGGA
mmetsp:Transcript_93967/g.262404  ORF Transcript_93967/g.262404 Transcript_93967/m.262404 type:complete len:321 (-) Transcript_93967:1118-2080(-)